MWKTGTMSVSSSVIVRLVQAIGEQKELHVPMTLISKTCLKLLKPPLLLTWEQQEPLSPRTSLNSIRSEPTDSLNPSK
jgi:hypothetical protein